MNGDINAILLINLKGTGAKVAPVFQSYGSHFQFTGALAPVLACFRIHCYIYFFIYINMQRRNEDLLEYTNICASLMGAS